MCWVLAIGRGLILLIPLATPESDTGKEWGSQHRMWAEQADKSLSKNPRHAVGTLRSGQGHHSTVPLELLGFAPGYSLQPC